MKPYTLPEVLRITENAVSYAGSPEIQSFKALFDHYCEGHKFRRHEDDAYWLALGAFELGRAIGIRAERERRKKK